MSTNSETQAGARLAEARIVWSRNGEDFINDAETLDELIDYIGGPEDFKPGQIVYFGEVKEHDTDWIDAGDVIDRISDVAYDTAGEFAEDFPSVSAEARAELDAFLKAWQAKHCKADFYRVINVREHVITADNLTPSGADDGR